MGRMNEKEKAWTKRSQMEGLERVSKVNENCATRKTNLSKILLMKGI